MEEIKKVPVVIVGGDISPADDPDDQTFYIISKRFFDRHCYVYENLIYSLVVDGYLTNSHDLDRVWNDLMTPGLDEVMETCYSYYPTTSSVIPSYTKKQLLKLQSILNTQFKSLEVVEVYTSREFDKLSETVSSNGYSVDEYYDNNSKYQFYYDWEQKL